MQDLLSQQPYMLAAVEPAIYVSGKPTEARVSRPSGNRETHQDENQCINILSVHSCGTQAHASFTLALFLRPKFSHWLEYGATCRSSRIFQGASDRFRDS
eukprot:4658108-Amphidinium_carterae.1